MFLFFIVVTWVIVDFVASFYFLSNAKLSYPDNGCPLGRMWMERKSGGKKVTRSG